MQTLNNYLNHNEKTIIIAPNKYHNKIIESLDFKNNVITNLQILSIEIFLKNTLSENLITFDDDSNVIEKIKINQHLIESNHQYANNINYVNELYKLKNEFFLSNVSTPDNFSQPISFTALDLSRATTNVQHLVILTTQDMYEIHFELLAILESKGLKITYLEEEKEAPILYTIEHKNTIRMLDYVLSKVLEIGELDQTLIICDDINQSDYLKSQLRTLNIKYNQTSASSHPDVYKLKSIFNVVENNYDDYDEKCINNLISKNELDFSINKLLDINSLDYKQYIESIYNLLIDFELFTLNDLNSLFIDLYKTKTTANKGILNQLLFTTLSNKLKQSKFNAANSITISDSSFNAFRFKHVFIVDTSLTAFKQQSPSYLLDVNQRLEIDTNLISVVQYSKIFKQSQKRLLSCGDNIYFNNALVSLDNKSKEPAFFISQYNDQMIKLDNTFKHIFTQSPNLTKEGLLEHVTLDKNMIINKLHNRLSISPSALDNYYTCPYKYFVTYILKPTQSMSFDSRDIGTIFHDCLEAINKMLIEQDKQYSDYDEEYYKQLISKLVNQELNKLTTTNNIAAKISNPKLAKMSLYLNQSLNNIIQFFRYFNTKSKYELNGSEAKLEKHWPNKHFDNVIFNGKVDSIFHNDDYNFVVDYKTTKKEFNKTDFQHGVSNQLMSYTYLIRNTNVIEGNNIRGAFFKPIKDTYTKTDDLFDTEAIKRNHLEDIKMAGIYIDDGDLSKNIDFDDTFKEFSTSELCDAVIENGKPSFDDKKTKVNTYNTVDLLNMHKVLEWHINRMIDNIASGNFDIAPYEEMSCKYCDYSAICHVNSSVKYRKDIAKDEYEEFEQANNEGVDDFE